jgi:hypothetical protein
MTPEQFEELNLYAMPGEFILWTDLNSIVLKSCVAAMVTSLITSQIICIVLVYSILKALKKNSSTFSKNTHKLNLQLTTLLGLQV